VYKQILIDEKLKTEGGQKTELTGRNSLRRRSSALERKRR
jgi:hypothetical protein